MKLIIGGRRSGKTVRLIEESNATGKPIVTCSKEQAKHVENAAKHMGIVIPRPYAIGDIQLIRGSSAKEVLVDNVDMVLTAMMGVRVGGLTLDTPKDMETLDKYNIYGLRKDNSYVEVIYENVPYSEVEPTLEALQKDNSDIYIRFFKGLYRHSTEI